MNSHLSILKLSAIVLAAASVSFEVYARPPRARVREARVERVDVNHRKLHVTINSKEVTIVWGKNTKFICCGTPVDVAAIKAGMMVTITYRTPAFGDLSAKRVDLCELVFSMVAQNQFMRPVRPEILE